MANITFEDWFKSLVDLSENTFGGIINKEDPEPYREYFNDGDTLEEVIKTEISYITKDIIQYAKNK